MSAARSSPPPTSPCGGTAPRPRRPSRSSRTSREEGERLEVVAEDGARLDAEPAEGGGVQRAEVDAVVEVAGSIEAGERRRRAETPPAHAGAHDELDVGSAVIGAAPVLGRTPAELREGHQHDAV